jgi:hypothetical protein
MHGTHAYVSLRIDSLLKCTGKSRAQQDFKGKSVTAGSVLPLGIEATDSKWTQAHQRLDSGTPGPCLPTYNLN